MKVVDLSPKMPEVNLELEILEMDNIHKFDRMGSSGKVCNALAKDDTGKVRLTLWNEQVDQCTVGDRIALSNGVVSEWQGALQVSAGRKGTIKKI
ncbi:MAG: SOSS complex subunit B family protein [Nanoarchaeota archaeon]